MRKKLKLLKLLVFIWQRKVVWQVVKYYYPICKIYTWIYTLQHQQLQKVLDHWETQLCWPTELNAL